MFIFRNEHVSYHVTTLADGRGKMFNFFFLILYLILLNLFVAGHITGKHWNKVYVTINIFLISLTVLCTLTSNARTTSTYFVQLLYIAVRDRYINVCLVQILRYIGYIICRFIKHLYRYTVLEHSVHLSCTNNKYLRIEVSIKLLQWNHHRHSFFRKVGMHKKRQQTTC